MSQDHKSAPTSPLTRALTAPSSEITSALDPHEEFDWVIALKRSIESNRDDPHHRFVQLATVTKKGEPHNRTLVYRGLDEDGSVLLCTDRRSAKMDELIERGSVELCWYFLKSREQYRLGGGVSFVNQASQRERVWSELSRETRAQFYWPTPREVFIEGEIARRVPDAQTLLDSPPPSNFVLFKVVPHRVDYLSLNSRHRGQDKGQHRRVISESYGVKWRSEEVNP